MHKGLGCFIIITTTTTLQDQQYLTYEQTNSRQTESCCE